MCAYDDQSSLCSSSPNSTFFKRAVGLWDYHRNGTGRDNGTVIISYLHSSSVWDIFISYQICIMAWEYTDKKNIGQGSRTATSKLSIYIRQSLITKVQFRFYSVLPEYYLSRCRYHFTISTCHHAMSNLTKLYSPVCYMELDDGSIKDTKLCDTVQIFLLLYSTLRREFCFACMCACLVGRWQWCRRCCQSHSQSVFSMSCLVYGLRR